MKIFPDVTVNSAILDPSNDPDSPLIVPGMKQSHIERAHVYVDQEGRVHVTWLKVVPSLRAFMWFWLDDMFRSFNVIIWFIILIVLFWAIGIEAAKTFLIGLGVL